MASKIVASEKPLTRPIRSMRGETYQSQVLVVKQDAPRAALADAMYESLHDVHDELHRLWIETINDESEFEHQMSAEDACNMASRCMNTLDRARGMLDALLCLQWEVRS